VPILRGKNSDGSLRSSLAESAPKLNNKNISQPSFIEVLDEDIEPTILSKDKKKHHQSGLLYSNKGGGDIEIDGLRNYLRVGSRWVCRPPLTQSFFQDTERRDSIPEEEYDQQHRNSNFMKPIYEIDKQGDSQ
jgi:hypothetical protein